MIYIYDIETYLNFFCITFKNVKTKEIKIYTIYHSYQNNNNNKNELLELYDFINSNKKKWLVGYNSKYFDNIILNYIYSNVNVLSMLSEEYACEDINTFALSIIEDSSSEYKYKLPFQSIDLMGVGNVQHKSLKLVAVNLSWPMIQDLPFKYDAEIKDEDLPILYKYNLNDVEITEKLYHTLLNDIKVRWEVGQEYRIDLMSESDSGMANRLLEKMYSDISDIKISDLRKLRTHRKIIHYENVVFEDINFKTDKLKTLYKEIRSQKYYIKQPYFNKSIVFNGVKYKLGIGGIHSDDKPGIFIKNDDINIIDCDISSMYPTLIVNNNLFPAHLSSLFLQLYKKLIDERLKAKLDGNETKAYVLKILVNSVFGKTLYENHWLYDPLVGLRVTINGQLYMLMLIEELNLAGFEVLSANTDGIVTIVPKNREKEYKEVCNIWSNKTNFNLEYTYYSKYVRRDVNNYIVEKENNGTKEKGVFLQYNNIALRQGIDKPIISKALYNFFIKGIPIETTIYDETDIYLFCTAKKTDDKFTNEFHTLENGIHRIEELQKSVRYYISTNGGALYKVDRKINKYINYCVNRKVTILNDNRIEKLNILNYNIDYGYYIKETQKIIDEINNPQLTLF